MNRYYSRRAVTAVAILSAAVLMGCGKTEPAPTPAPNPAPAPAPVAPACVNLVPDAPIGFTATGATANSANIYIGQLPWRPSGQVALTPGVAGGNLNAHRVFGTISLNVQVPTTPTTGSPYQGGYYGGWVTGDTPVNLTGVVTLNAATIQDVQARMGYYTYNPTYLPTTPGTTPVATQPALCLSNLAINTGVKMGAVEPLYSTTVYLYFNNSPTQFIAVQ